MSKILSKILSVANRDGRNVVEQMLKLQEESGELATEVGKQIGLKVGRVGKDGVRGEAADVILAAISVYAKTGLSASDLEADLLKKLAKWDQKLLDKQKKNETIKKCSKSQKSQRR